MVCTSTIPSHLCINGMSFSTRSSPWANAALVVGVSEEAGDFDVFIAEHGVLAGMAFQVRFLRCHNPFPPSPSPPLPLLGEEWCWGCQKT